MVYLREICGFFFLKKYFFKVLKALEGAILRNKSEEEVKKYLEETSNKWLPLHSNESSKVNPLQEERRKDHISHFILRLAYSRT
jgi:DNA primase large subunit